MSDQQIHIRLFDTVPIIPPLTVLPVGVHTFRIHTGGNSFLSTAYCRSAAAPVVVRYYDSGAAREGDPGWEFDLGSHLPLSAGDHDRQVFTRIHNNLRCEVTVTGGPADVGILGTVVSDFPAKIDTSGSDVNTNVVTTGHIDNFSMPLANNEYQYTFPVGTRRFTIKNRINGMIQVAYNSGESGTKFWTVEPGTAYFENDLKIVSGLSIFLQSPSPNQILEISYWS